jgi:protein-arginine kinase activator protein McsA
MTEEQINKIADLIVEKLSAKQEEYDKAFQADMQSMIAESQEESNISFGMTTPQEMIKDQLIKLELELDEAVANEDYNMAEKIKQKLIQLKAKYKL